MTASEAIKILSSNEPYAWGKRAAIEIATEALTKIALYSTEEVLIVLTILQETSLTSSADSKRRLKLQSRRLSESLRRG